jgi:5'-nucleotidase
MVDDVEVLPFEDAVVCLEVSCLWLSQDLADIQIDGKGIWGTMEGALSKWPAQEG